MGAASSGGGTRPALLRSGALSPGVGAGRAGTGYRADLDALCLRHFLPADRFPDETRSQEETSQLSQIGRKNMECVLPLTEHNQMNCPDSSLQTSS